MFVCIHSRRRGPACGGTRLKTYPDLADAMADAMKLSTAMTLKMAVADMPFGGGKAVLAVPATLSEGQRHDLILRYADLVASLGGSFQTGPDINTSIADMDLISERCPYVVCRSVERGGSGDPGKYTARGVFHGIRASVNKAFGSPELEGRTVLVQALVTWARALRNSWPRPGPGCWSVTSRRTESSGWSLRSMPNRSRWRRRSELSATCTRPAPSVGP